MKKITVLEFRGRDNNSGLLKECVEKAINEHKNVHKGLGAGLELLVTRNTGSANFYYKSKKLGSVSHMSLSDAFKKIEQIKAEEKKKKQTAVVLDNSPLFCDFFKSWLDSKSKSLKKNSNRTANLIALFNHTLYPLHNIQLSAITPHLVYEKISAISQSMGNKHNAVQMLIQCLRNAALRGLISSNPLEGMLKGSESPFKKPKSDGWRWVDADKLREKYFEPLKSTFILNRVFYLLIALTAFRFNECRLLRYSWINFEDKVIVIPPDAVYANKTQKPLVKPLTIQVEKLLRYWRQNGAECSDFVFKSIKADKAIAEATLREPLKALTTRECDFHGLRKSMKTWLLAKGNQNEFISELCLTHDVRSALQKTYDKNEYIEEVRAALQLWNDYIESNLPDEFKQLIS